MTVDGAGRLTGVPWWRGTAPGWRWCTGPGRTARLEVGAVVRVDSADGGQDVCGRARVPSRCPTCGSPATSRGPTPRRSPCSAAERAGRWRRFYVDIDGYDVVDVEPLADPVSITAAPPVQPQENPLVVGTAAGELMQFTSGGGWQTSDRRRPGLPGLIAAG